LLLAIGCYGDHPPGHVDNDEGTRSPPGDALDAPESDTDTDADTDGDTDLDTDTGDTMRRSTADTSPGSTGGTADSALFHTADTGTSATSDSGDSIADSGCDYGYDDVLYCGYNCGPGMVCLGCLSIGHSHSDSGSEVFIDYFCYTCGGAC
jgi:hypothetical protein